MVVGGPALGLGAFVLKCCLFLGSREQRLAIASWGPPHLDRGGVGEAVCLSVPGLWLCCLLIKPGVFPGGKGGSLHLSSQALGLLGLARLRAHQPEVGSHSSVTSPWGAGGCPVLHFASYQPPSSTKR